MKSTEIRSGGVEGQGIGLTWPTHHLKTIYIPLGVPQMTS